MTGTKGGGRSRWNGTELVASREGILIPCMLCWRGRKLIRVPETRFSSYSRCGKDEGERYTAECRRTAGRRSTRPCVWKWVRYSTMYHQRHLGFRRRQPCCAVLRYAALHHADHHQLNARIGTFVCFPLSPPRARRHAHLGVPFFLFARKSSLF